MLVLPKAKKSTFIGASGLRHIKKIVAGAALAVSLALGGTAAAYTGARTTETQGVRDSGALVLSAPALSTMLAAHGSHESHASHASHYSHESHASHASHASSSY